MASKIATVTSKGQVTIPVEVRSYLDVKEGDGLLFIRDADRVYVERIPGKVTAKEVFGSLHRPGEPTLDIEKARAEVWAERASRHDPEQPDTEEDDL